MPERAVGGGSINDCYRWSCSRGPLFVKVADTARLPMFEAEAAGLEELRAAAAVRVPQVMACGAISRDAILVLEWIDAGPPTPPAERELGTRLALQHRVTQPLFGWHRYNTIGLTPQRNSWTRDWQSFYREQRLRPQLDLAVRNGHGGVLGDAGQRLLERLDALIADHRPDASLLHGDLWGGNWFADAGGAPVIFDPAVYYGDREADLAMTRLFGGFGADFYAAYHEAWPLEDGERMRRDLYDLYHVLNHANLFGGGYARQARVLIDRLLAQA